MGRLSLRFAFLPDVELHPALQHDLVHDLLHLVASDEICEHPNDLRDIDDLFDALHVALHDGVNPVLSVGFAA